MRNLVLIVGLLFLAGCGGSSSSKNTTDLHPDQISLTDLDNGGYIIKANIHSLSDGSAAINGIDVYFCKNGKYKDVYPNGHGSKGTYTINKTSQKMIISISSPNVSTFTLDNNSDFLAKGSTYDVTGDLIDYSFTTVENTKSPSVNCD